MAELDTSGLLAPLAAEGVEELLLSTGRRPHVRAGGRLRASGAEPIAGTALEALLGELASAAEGTRRASFVCEREGLGRLLVRTCRDRLGLVLLLRRIPREPASFDALGLPEAVRRLADRRRGLVLAAGPPGCGKTAALAAMVAALNSRADRARLVVTVERAVEYVHESRGALVVQLEAGVHCASLAAGVREALSMGADVVLCGGIDDLPTAEAVLDAAAGGALVLAEVLAPGASAAIERVLGFFPEHMRRAARSALAGALAGAFSARRLPRRDGRGTISAFEVLVSTATVAASIRESGAAGLAELMGRAGMMTLDSELLALVGTGLVGAADAAAAASDEAEFLRRCEAEGLPAAQGELARVETSSPPAPVETKTEGTGALPSAPAAAPTREAVPPAPKARSFTTRRLSRSEMLLGASADAAERSAPQFLDPRAIAGRKVLVVDDDDGVRELVTRILRSAGADVWATSEPARALEAVRSGSFDLAVFDIMMPGLTGTELYDGVVEARPELRERILFLTAHDLDERLTGRIVARGGKVVRKPFGADDLLKAAAFALSHHGEGP